MDEDKKFELLKKINTKMGWALFFLICITLNTCSVADDIEEAVRDRRAAEAVPAEAPTQG